MDSTSPYIAWDDEYSALRGNLNTFFNLAVMLLLAGLVAGVCILLFEVIRLPVGVFYAVLFIALAAGMSITFCVGTRRILANMERL